VNLEKYHKIAKPPALALPLLEAGGYFVLKPRAPRPRSRALVFRMGFRLADGTELEGKWNHPKVKLERMARLTEGISHDGYRCWTLKKETPVSHQGSEKGE
jgi:hypothetical protein